MRLSALAVVAAASTAAASKPFVVLHGIGDDCSNRGMKNFVTDLQDQLPGVYGTCVEAGGTMDSWFTTMETQVEKACSIINQDENYADGYNIVGLSQGNLVARGLIESCDGPPVSAYVSLGGPHMGVASMPDCSTGIICDMVNGFIDAGVYLSLAQNNVAPANYFCDPKDYDKYLEKCNFLPDIDNQKDDKSDDYKTRFSSLTQLTLVKFEDDQVLDPRETSWFGFYELGGKDSIVTMKDQDLYKEDWIGLRTLDESGRVELVSQPGQHLNITDSLITDTIVPALQ
mmetsp:Transcript_22981/g.45851  ORF Transcript_22981/g.45851 Transcript_22981/m.45851 type:complete len:286 (+) Transcript_22981:16-873(+)